MNATMHNRPAPCYHCDRPLGWTTWCYVGDGEYEALCWRCRQRCDRTFTKEAALTHAIIIIGLHQGRMNVERMPDGGSFLAFGGDE